MTLKDDLLVEFEEWSGFVDRIAHQDWNVSLGEGKWTIHDVVCHIYLWDKYFLEEAIKPISEGQPLTLRHLDYNEFNRKAVEAGSKLTKPELIELTRQFRSSIVTEIRDQEPSKFTEEYVDADGNKFSVESYLKDFIWHDRHHMKQIEDLKE
ncbi:DinB family protein [Paenibacillus tuaregi]|uniref:DinB family protein n=1 Tax=Paenibacillus tuaregi TaxID=1816681 RepID=UPI000837B28D|nr:DinB family protein [Paenibacillus tuaregi]